MLPNVAMSQYNKRMRKRDKINVLVSGPEKKSKGVHIAFPTPKKSHAGTIRKYEYHIS